MAANVDMLVLLIQQRRDQIIQANNVMKDTPQYDWFVGIYDDICDLIKQYGPTML